MEHTRHVCVCLYANRWANWTVFFLLFVFVWIGTCFTCGYNIFTLSTCSFFLSLCESQLTHILFIFCILKLRRTRTRLFWTENKNESQLYNMSLCHWNREWKRNGDVDSGDRIEIYNALFWILNLKSSHSHLIQCVNILYSVYVSMWYNLNLLNSIEKIKPAETDFYFELHVYPLRRVAKSDWWMDSKYENFNFTPWIALIYIVHWFKIINSVCDKSLDSE